MCMCMYSIHVGVLWVFNRGMRAEGHRSSAVWSSHMEMWLWCWKICAFMFLLFCCEMSDMHPCHYRGETKPVDSGRNFFLSRKFMIDAPEMIIIYASGFTFYVHTCQRASHLRLRREGPVNDKEEDMSSWWSVCLMSNAYPLYAELWFVWNM